MSNTARKARKREGISFTRTAKVGTPGRHEPRERPMTQAQLRAMYEAINSTDWRRVLAASSSE